MEDSFAGESTSMNEYSRFVSWGDDVNTSCAEDMQHINNDNNSKVTRFIW
jgi:hypothetical protein